MVRKQEVAIEGPAPAVFVPGLVEMKVDDVVLVHVDDDALLAVQARAANLFAVADLRCRRMRWTDVHADLQAVVHLALEEQRRRGGHGQHLHAVRQLLLEILAEVHGLPRQVIEVEHQRAVVLECLQLLQEREVQVQPDFGELDLVVLLVLCVVVESRHRMLPDGLRPEADRVDEDDFQVHAARSRFEQRARQDHG